MFRLIFSNPVRLLEFLAVVAFLLFLMTQVAIPLITNSSLFPWFSRKPKLKREIAAANEAIEEESLASELVTKQRVAKTLRERRETVTTTINPPATSAVPPQSVKPATPVAPTTPPASAPARPLRPVASPRSRTRTEN